MRDWMQSKLRWRPSQNERLLRSQMRSMKRLLRAVTPYFSSEMARVS